MNNSINLLQSFFQKWSYYCLFFGLLLEGTFFTGFLVPGTLILVLGGFWSANEGGITILASIGLSFCGIIVGDNASYLIGRSRLSNFSIFRRFKSMATSADIANKKYILLFQFTSLTRGLLPFYLGLNQYPYNKWLTINVFASLIFVATMFGIGYVGGLYWHNLHTSTMLSDYTQYFFNVILVIILIKFYIKRRNNSQ